MEKEKLLAGLNELVGHLEINTTEEKKKLDRLGKLLTATSFTEGEQGPIKKSFSIEKSDLFFKDRIKTNQKKIIDRVVDVQESEPTQYKVFRREVPVRDQLLHGSIASWAVGAKVEHTVGPFTNKDGRQFWYDFFPIEKLVSLYMQGMADPILMFKVRTTGRLTVTTALPITANPATTYTLVKGSIWIASKFLAPNAPAGSYTGLTIEGGKVTLSKMPQMANNKLTVSATTRVTVQLKLAQPPVSDADNDSPYGGDARAMQLELPKTLDFQFTGNGRTVDAVGEAQWKLYGQSLDFQWNSGQQTTFDSQLQRIFFPFKASESQVVIQDVQSDFNTVGGESDIDRCGWVLPVASIDVTQPTQAAGIGEMFVQCKQGLVEHWQQLQGGKFALQAPGLLVGPGQIMLTDLSAQNPHAYLDLALWQDELNPFGTGVKLVFPDNKPFFYATNANGNELLMTSANARFKIDRPVQVNGHPPKVRSLNSLLVLAVSKTNRLIYLFDDNLIQDDAQLDNEDPIVLDRMAFALTNALFKVSQPNGCMLFGSLTEAFDKVDKGYLFLTFGLLAYIPTLPDPYAANLGVLKRQVSIPRTDLAAGVSSFNVGQVTSWLVCRIAWDVPADDTGNDEVTVSFHFAPLGQQFAGISFNDPETNVEADAEAAPASSPTAVTGDFSGSVALDPRVTVAGNTLSEMATHHFSRNVGVTTHAAAISNPDIPKLPDYEEQWDKESLRYRRDLFALLDVSTNADLFGISFDLMTRRDFSVTTNVDATTGETTASFFPVQIQGMDVVSTGANVKAFTVPQISWEPTFNLSPPQPPPDGPLPGDPPGAFNYYPNDGGPTHILNNSGEYVPLAPLPVTDFLVKHREENDAFNAISFFTLPFGIRAAALLAQQYKAGNDNRPGGDLTVDEVTFDPDIKGGLQLRMDGGMPLNEGDSNMFMGTTVQLNNILNMVGTDTGSSTLGDSVTRIFNGEFFNPPPGPFNLLKQRGVPVTRMDLSGYGASMFSDWLNTKAALAQTSQSKFDVFVGRCGHEVIQVKSVVYPWMIKVVRTITIFRVASGYVYRFDSGWKAESDGKFDLRYYVTKETDPAPRPAYPRTADYEIHPGIVRALYNVTNIIETGEISPYDTQMTVAPNELYVNEDGAEVQNTSGGNLTFPVFMRAVYFDADVDIDGAVSGMVNKKTSEGDKNVVSSKRIVGFVQLAPKGQPLKKETFKSLVARQGNIGGPIDCEVDLAESTQKMRLNRFDFNNSFAANGTDPIFSVAGRGNVLLPKDGSWSMVKHARATGEVSPAPANLSIPVIREGKVVEDGDSVKIEVPVGGTLTRIAEPTELLRQPIDATINYGFLQSTDTQKALFLTPSYKKSVKKLLSKTPPLFVDAFRIVNSKGIFPNIGTADVFTGDVSGEAILMKKGGNFPFGLSNLKDVGKDVFELMDVQDTIDGLKQQGMQLLHNPEDAFDLPTEFELINLGDGNFRIYIEYAKKDKNGNVEQGGALDFDINSVTKSWKSKMNNIGLVLDLGGIDRLMTIKGNWDSENGKEASYPKPELQFSPELQPLIDLLEILESLQSGDYGEAVGNGLKLAMSNKAGSWEYKLEATKEIPVLRFPVPDAVYNDPNTPFKLECGLTIGAYFNAAIKVTTDANELLPSAGGILGFYARLSVMCVSISAATIYAIGQANVDIAADTKLGPSLRMKFGFGAQIVVGLPVIGNVSVLYVVGAEIFVAEGIVEVSAFLLFEGHAEILGGIVSITIMIEAKGTYSKKQIPGGTRTDLACQVTFGLDISIAFIINISFTESWQEQRQIA